MKNSIFRHFSKILKFNNPCDVKKSKLGQNGAKFVYYIRTVLKRSNSITMVFSRLVIHFQDWCSETVILWSIPNPSFWHHSKTGQKRPKFVHLVLLIKKSQNPYIMKHWDEENVYEADFNFIKFLSPSYDVINAILGQKGPEFVKIKISNHAIFVESNSFTRSVFEHYKILMPLHPLLSRCDTSLIPSLVKKGHNLYITNKFW